MPDDGEQRPSGPPDYKVYRSRKGLFSRFRRPDLSGLRERAKTAREAATGREPRARRERRLPSAPDTPARRSSNGSASPPWAGSCSASSPSRSRPSCSPSSSPAKRRTTLHGNPFLLVKPQTILVLGTDARPPDSKEPGAAPSEECFEQQSHGEAPHEPCSEGEFRADTLMLIRAGGGAFRKLSIPRDAYAEIPGQSPQKINGAFAFGGAALQIEAVEQFLGIEIDHVAIVDFTGFEDLIDAVGGVEVDVPVKLCADISGGAGGGQGGVTLRLGKGENTLDGEKALAYARIRKPSECPGPGPSAYSLGYDDFDRERGPAGGDQRDQGPAHRPAPPPLQLRQGPDHRLERAEGVRQRHGLLHDAAAGARRRRSAAAPRPTSSAAGATPAAAKGPAAASKSRSRSAARPSTSC